MIKSKEFMDAIKGQVEAFEFDDLYALESDVSDGSSYSGFDNYTDGFVYRQAIYRPRLDNPLTFKGFDAESEKRAKEVQELHDGYCSNTDNSTDQYWYDKIRGTDNEKRWTDSKSFVKWYNDFNFDSGSELDEELYYDVQEYNDNWFDESEAFIGVAIRLYDNDNRRNESESGKPECVVESYFNDDFSYGRESISWCKGVGKHVVYSADFEYTDLKDLQSKLAEHLPKAFESIGQC